MKDIAIIDIEASGLHFDSYPIEVAVLIEGRCKSWLIKPEPNWNYWCKTAESLHGIPRNLIEKKGLHAVDVAVELNNYLSDFKGCLYSDAERWDTDWIDTLYFAVNKTRSFHLGSIYDLLEKNQAHEFDRQKARLAESGKYRQHRATEDVRMIFEAYSEISK